MPFANEYASKTGHNDIQNNPDVIKFLEQCPDVEKPEVSDLLDMLLPDSAENYFQQCMNAPLPKFVLSLDGSNYESIVDKRFPSRKIGYIKISTVLLEMEQYNELASCETSRYVNPMAVAKLQEDTTSISLVVPGSYVQFPEDDSPFETMRRTLLKGFTSDHSRLNDSTLLDTLFQLALRINKAMDKDGRFFILEKCPNRGCSHRNMEIPFNPGMGICPSCQKKVFATDILRVHEAFSNTGDNTVVYSRVRNVIEHIALFHYIFYVWKNDIETLSNLGVIMDGPLAIFGEGADFHRALMLMYQEMREDCYRSGYRSPLVIGITKTGRVVEHFMSIKHLMPEKTIFPINDQYRYQFINEVDDASEKKFGIETYYGQDFLIKTAQNRQFIICVQYPFGRKIGSFHEDKVKIENYPEFESIVKLVMTFETDMYENALTPVVLAHRHASISQKPGGKMLDILSRKHFK